MDYFFRFPGGRDRALTFSYDDGVEQDERIIALLKSHRMKGTFNISGDLFWPENWLAWQATATCGMPPTARSAAT